MGLTEVLLLELGEDPAIRNPQVKLRPFQVTRNQCKRVQMKFPTKKKSHKNYEVSLKSEKWHLKMYCSWSDPFGNGCLLLSRMAYPSLGILPEAHKGTLVPTAHLPELVSTLRGLLDVVRALVPLGVFWAALAAAASAAKFCNCIAFNPATSKERDQPHIHPRGASYPLQQWQLTLAEG